MKLGLMGATGYTGIELTRLLSAHPEVSLCHLTTESYEGKKIHEVYPHLRGLDHLTCEKPSLEKLMEDCDLIMMALPAGQAEKWVPELLKANKKIIDLSPDHRLTAVYGLPEMGNRKLIQEVKLVANPGCYATACILAALPALRAKIISPDDCIFDAKSGISGAGRSLSLKTHFCEMQENFMPYHPAGLHRHNPEIEAMLSGFIAEPLTIQFTPHLLPILRGISVTAYFKLKGDYDEKEVEAIYQEFYRDEPFVHIQEEIPAVKQVRGTNHCVMSLHLDKRTSRLIVISVIDNLIKGAAGQAVQNMNLICGWPETLGLGQLSAMYP